MRAGKVVSAAEAAALVKDGDTVTTSGFVGIGVPDELLAAIETRFLETDHPRDLSLVFAAGQGDGKDRGLNRLGHEGLLKRVVGGHWGLIPKVAKLATEGKIEGWNLPQGVISQLYRDIAAGKPGMLSKVGLETFVDPRQGGGAVNSISTDPQVELMEIGGEEILFYPSHNLTVALLRGTTADETGNVTMEREALTIDNLAQAMAVHNAGGVVIVQVERVARAGSLPARDVHIPGILVDAIVVSKPENHLQTYSTAFSQAFTNRIRPPSGEIPALPLDARKVIARRCAFELPVNGVVNLGIGMPEGVASVAAEEGLLEHLTLTAEPGVIGGQPASGLDFGAAVNTDAVIPQNNQFDFYDGGGLDMACLGLAQADAVGNVNVSRFGTRLAGAGGFINISQNARAVVFAGTFTAQGLDVHIGDDGVEIRQEGRARKFLDHVEQISFSGARAARLGQPVLYVTERCVFELTTNGLELKEIAPGIDLDRDILGLMDVRPIVNEVTLMDARIFRNGEMDLRIDLLHLDLPDRIAIDPNLGQLFLNFEKMRIRTLDEVKLVERLVAEACVAYGKPVNVVVNYDGFRIDEALVSDWAKMVDGLTERFYRNVSRYSGSAFMRMKLGEVFPDARTHIYESREKARSFPGSNGA
ncbi:acetyl-CoA--acetoacetyl-CoA transferase subunit alpha [Litoreibacter arenae]|uniref:Acetyl-CoA:acetoacetyl-CoA transferase, alpha subunit n=1 Tax=Litoreibacter arenae DSM 19593 TaxID=1123360 RepID=S9QF45_9RHOB|nr:acetyl-CoA--acetoacetyl-CoA transferase subunit alpha [Litoreibacter arenae]EPX78193.1 Acetyl-CoA:acetoacetyl-CoA transferase, alpha subunit [Litoreibacter arenae DSM 19593]